MYLEKQIIQKNCLKGLRTVVIENEQDERDLLAYILESHGAVVFSEASVSDAIGRLRYYTADVVFVSVEAIEEHQVDIRANICAKAGKEVLIIGVAESERFIYPAIAQDLNCHACISKPLDIIEVVDFVATLAGRHERQNHCRT
ncbi:response regulator receiver protein [Calothrix sp. NIES-4071]|nr:response regulator receiver protein [Calothrix sp. NIES-4071]BAZ60614.1 response regulator receiver protein [Calothrix sp. NIES-4105]